MGKIVSLDDVLLNYTNVQYSLSRNIVRLRFPASLTPICYNLLGERSPMPKMKTAVFRRLLLHRSAQRRG